MNTSLPTLVYYTLAGDSFGPTLSNAIAIASGKVNVEHTKDWNGNPVVMISRNADNRRVPEISESYKAAEAYFSKEELSAMPFARTVQFEFNGATVIVNHDSDPELIERDWRYAMEGWLNPGKVAGPYPRLKLTSEELARKAEYDYQYALRSHARQMEWEEEERQKLQVYKLRIAASPEYSVGDQEALDRWETSNPKNENGKENYGSVVVSFAKDYGRLLQAEMAKGIELEDAMEECEKVLYVYGISGFQWGGAKAILCSTWEHGARARGYFLNKAVSREWDWSQHEIDSVRSSSFKSDWMNFWLADAQAKATQYSSAHNMFVAAYQRFLDDLRAGQPPADTLRTLESYEATVKALREEFMEAYFVIQRNKDNDDAYYQNDLDEQEIALTA